MEVVKKDVLTFSSVSECNLSIPHAPPFVDRILMSGKEQPH